MSFLTHDEKIVMKTVFKQAEPKVYSPVEIDDYMGRILRNEVFQPESDIGKLTDSLYSSMKPVKTKSSFYDIPKKPKSIYPPNEQDHSYSFQEDEQDSPYSSQESNY